jgi:PAS domain S-box-containing protein
VIFQVHISHSRERRYTFVSEGVREMFGVEPEAVLADGMLLKRFRHPDDNARVTAAMAGAPGSRLALEYRIRLDDGRVKWVHLNSSPTAFDADGELRTAVMVDITARVQADAALREQEERWKLALESTGDGVWDWDLVTNAKTLSPRCLDMYGMTDADTVSHDALDRRVHPDDLPLLMRQREAHLTGQTPSFMNERRVQCADGSWKWILSRGMVISRDAAGRPLRMIGTHTDITERKAAETLRQERDRAEAASRATTQFLSRVSHELRTPLNAVLGFAQLLELDAAVPPAQRAWVAQILQSGRHLLGLVDDVLDLSSVQTGQFAFACSEVDLGEAVHEAWTMLAASAAEAGLAYAPALPGQPLLVRADARRLRQVLSNLLHNAIKYNRPGGRVSVDAAHVGLAIELRVHDTGKGLGADELGRIFMPFERLGAQRGGIPGTGLGLALSRQLTEAMGGALRVHSRPGVGSTFVLTLPAAREGGDPGAVQAWPTDSTS